MSEPTEVPGTIQAALARAEPELLDFLRQRQGDPPEFVAVAYPASHPIAACQRCGALVVDEEPHTYWHESLTMGFDAMAALILTSRRDV